MHVIVWEFRSREGREAEFERAYGPEGDWVRFFAKGTGYLGTELFVDPAAPGRYLTIDRWTSAAAYEAFRAEHAVEYRELDRRCKALTEREAPLGSFLSVAEAPPRSGARGLAGA